MLRRSFLKGLAGVMGVMAANSALALEKYMPPRPLSDDWIERNILKAWISAANTPNETMPETLWHLGRRGLGIKKHKLTDPEMFDRADMAQTVCLRQIGVEMRQSHDSKRTVEQREGYIRRFCKPTDDEKRIALDQLWVQCVNDWGRRALI